MATAPLLLLPLLWAVVMVVRQLWQLALPALVLLLLLPAGLG